MALIPRDGFNLEAEPSPGLTDEARALLVESFAPETRRAYSRIMRHWAAFCEVRGLQSWPPDPVTVCNYLADMHREERKASSIELHASALSSVAQRAGLPSLRAHPLVRATIRGLKKTAAPAQGAAYVDPATMGQIAAWLGERADAGDVVSCRDRALLLLGYASACRASELCALQLGDVEPRTWGLVLHLRRHFATGREVRNGTKTSPEPVSVEVLASVQPDRCPVRAWQAWLALHPAPEPSAWAWPAAQGKGRPGGAAAASVRPLRPRAFRDLCARLRRRLAGEVAGVDALTPHALRVGYLTTAARQGGSLADLQRQARHKSAQTTLRYLRAAELGSGTRVL